MSSGFSLGVKDRWKKGGESKGSKERSSVQCVVVVESITSYKKELGPKAIRSNKTSAETG